MLNGGFKNLPPDSWKPFGNGVRGCIGRPFAWQESLLIVAMASDPQLRLPCWGCADFNRSSKISIFDRTTQSTSLRSSRPSQSSPTTSTCTSLRGRDGITGPLWGPVPSEQKRRLSSWVRDQPMVRQSRRARSDSACTTVRERTLRPRYRHS